MTQPEKQGPNSRSSGVIPPGGFQAPKGTRDFYPREMMIRRYITDTWRRVSLRHGFDEIDGPTFEHADLYTVKSGDGILSELFSFRREGGEDLYALRPEFTPTLARMYTARARQLPQPTKWFCVSNFFRAERPQRGRLREFFQWNCDVMGIDTADADSETCACAIAACDAVGMNHEMINLKLSDRCVMSAVFFELGIPKPLQASILSLLDQRSKLDGETFAWKAAEIGVTKEIISGIDYWIDVCNNHGWGRALNDIFSSQNDTRGLDRFFDLVNQLDRQSLNRWWTVDMSIVRGLAYYTGTVFEVIAEGERAVAGGGRYDKLIELFGGPPTPACGFGMGDAVLGNLLEDRKLFPEGAEMLEALSRPLPLRPDVFVIASPNEGCAEQIIPTVAALRRGVESEKYRQGECKPWSPERYEVRPLHARRSYKATKNVGKLLSDAGACFARFAAIIETPETVTLKNLQTREEMKDVPLVELGKRVAASSAG